MHYGLLTHAALFTKVQFCGAPPQNLSFSGDGADGSSPLKDPPNKCGGCYGKNVAWVFDEIKTGVIFVRVEQHDRTNVTCRWQNMISGTYRWIAIHRSARAAALFVSIYDRKKPISSAHAKNKMGKSWWTAWHTKTKDWNEARKNENKQVGYHAVVWRRTTSGEFLPSKPSFWARRISSASKAASLR